MDICAKRERNFASIFWKCTRSSEFFEYLVESGNILSIMKISQISEIYPKKQILFHRPKGRIKTSSPLYIPKREALKNFKATYFHFWKSFYIFRNVSDNFHLQKYFEDLKIFNVRKLLGSASRRPKLF